MYSFWTDSLAETLNRLGFWITLNMCSILLPATRNSIWLILFKLPQENIIHIHKFNAVLCVISVIVKLVVVLVYKDFRFLFLPLSPITLGSPLGGTISSLGIIFTSLVAIPIIRRKIFEVFFYSHRFLVAVIISTAIWHYLIVLYYLLPAIVLYIVDLCFRYYYTHKVTYGSLKKLGDEKYKTSTVLLYVTSPKPIKTFPGCFFYICHKCISIIEWHPLSLISEASDNNLCFCAKDVVPNTWTNKLKKFDDALMKNKDRLKNSDIYIQGPYKTSIIDYTKYSYIMTITGGIGITPVISVMKHISQLYCKKKLIRVKKVVFVWIVNHPSMIEPFNEILAHLNTELFDLQIYSTNKNDEETALLNLHVSLNIKYERPKISSIIHEFIDDNKISSSELGVISCGPSRCD